MKHLKTAVAALTLAASTMLAAQQPDQSPQPAGKPQLTAGNIRTRGMQPYIINRELQLWAGFRKGDADTLRAMLAPDFKAKGEGETVTRAEVLAQISTCKLGAFSLGDFHFRQPDADTAVLDYKVTRDLTCGDTHLSGEAHASTTWKRQSGPGAYAGEATWLAHSHTEKAVR